MYTAMGALSPEQQAEFRSLLPSCYSESFNTCWQDEPSDFPGCQRLNALYDLDEDGTEAMVAEMPFCPLPSEAAAAPAQDIGRIVIFASVAGVIGLGLGYLIGS